MHLAGVIQEEYTLATEAKSKKDRIIKDGSILLKLERRNDVLGLLKF